MTEIGRLHPDGSVESITISQEELGFNCWLPTRFLGGECDRYLQCDYPEKQSCRAIASILSEARQRTRERFRRGGQVG